jgi:seryl-tRNA synthetase
VAGQKFYYLKHEAVLLDLALQHFALGVAARHGFILHTTPDLARDEILRGLGFQPRGESTQVYSVADSDLCLVGTAEITLGGMLADAILDEERLPLLLAGLSHCFRTEAGSAGQESRGLYRVHQFTKVELFAFTTPDQSEVMHARLLAIEEEIFQALKIPYRVLDIASGDLGGPAYRKFDLEAWMPGRGAFGEITSTSNCTDYQARRLKIRYRPTPRPSGPAGGDGKPKPRHVHMLNGTAVATSRALVAILENYQQKDGSVRVPDVLQPLVGTSVIGPRAPRAAS